jgi:GR25 family glycosyltransferase involved in LPS biosynthesis
VKTLIISRIAEDKRRRFQSQQMTKLGLDYQFLDAFEARDLSAEDCQQAANGWPSPTLRQDIACFTSHRMAWKAVVERKEKTLILEDDAVLSSDIAQVMETIAARNDDWNCVYDLEFVPLPHILGKSPFWADAKTGFKASRVFQNRLGLAAYIIGPEAAARMLEDTKRYSLIDAFFWHRAWLKAYQIEPAPVIQQRFLEEHSDKPVFLRMANDDTFRPQGRQRKHLLRLWLEAIKARNLLRGAFRSEKRAVEIDKAKFSLDPAASTD